MRHRGKSLVAFAAAVVIAANVLSGCVFVGPKDREASVFTGPQVQDEQVKVLQRTIDDYAALTDRPVRFVNDPPKEAGYGGNRLPRGFMPCTDDPVGEDTEGIGRLTIQYRLVGEPPSEDAMRRLSQVWSRWGWQIKQLDSDPTDLSVSDPAGQEDSSRQFSLGAVLSRTMLSVSVTGPCVPSDTVQKRSEFGGTIGGSFIIDEPVLEIRPTAR